MSDILNPPTEHEQVDSRDIPKGRPAQPASAQPASAQPAAAQPAQQEEAAPQTVPMEQAPLVQEQLFSHPEVLHPDRYTRVPGENISNGYVDTARDVEIELLRQNNELNADVFTRQLSPFVQTADPLPDIGIDLQSVTDRAEASRKEFMDSVTRMNSYRPTMGIEFGNMERLPDGSLIPRVGALDNQVATGGLESDLLRGLQNTFDPEGVKNTVGDITDFMFRDAFNLLRGMRKGFTDIPVLGWIPNELGKRIYGEEKWESGKDSAYSAAMETVNRAFTPGGAAVTPGERPGAFADFSFGDYGNAGALSLARYIIETPGSMLTGAVYDVADEIVRHKTGDDPYKGSRAWDALVKAREWYFTKEWTPENYMGLQEPEGFEPGERATDKSIPPALRWWWNLPENTLDTLGIGTEDPQVTKYTHWALQGLPSFAVDFTIGGLSDKLVAKLLKLGNVATSVPQSVVDDIVEQANDVVKRADPVIVPVHPDVNTLPDEAWKGGKFTVTDTGILVKSPDNTYIHVPARTTLADDMNSIREIDVSDLIPEVHRSVLPDSDTLVPTRLTTVVDRTLNDIEEIAQVTSHVSGRPYLQPGGELSINEAQVLRSLDPDRFGRFGIEPKFPVGGEQVRLDNLDVSLFPAPDKMGDLLNQAERRVDSLVPPLTVDEVLSDLSKGVDVPDASSLRRTDLAFKAGRKQAQLAKAADNGVAYPIVRDTLPPSFTPPQVSDVAGKRGNDLVESALHVNGAGREAKHLRKLEGDLSAQVRQLDIDTQVYNYSRGDELVEDVTKLADDSVPELPMTSGTLTDDANPGYLNPEDFSAHDPLNRLSSELDSAKPTDELKVAKSVVDEAKEARDFTTDIRPAGAFDSENVRGFRGDSTRRIVTDTFEVPDGYLPRDITGMRVFHHGTGVANDLHTIDPILGGSPSELGLGIYLTPDTEVAKAAARSVFSNKPRASSEIYDGFGRIYTIDLAKDAKVLNGISPVFPSIRKVWERSVEDTFDNFGVYYGRRFSANLQNKMVADLFSEFDIHWKNITGDIPSAEVTRKFQQTFTQALRDNGVDGMFLTRNERSLNDLVPSELVVYNPGKLQITSSVKFDLANDISEPLESVRFLEKNTYELLPNDVTKSHYLNAKQQFTTHQLQQVAEARAQVEEELAGHVGRLFDSVDDLQDETIDQLTRRIDDVKVDSPRRTVEKFDLNTDSKYWNSPC